MAESPLAADLAGATLLSDSELVVKARQGDRRAFGTLYLRHHDAAWRVACAASGVRADAEDAVAEGFTKVFAALPRIVDRDLAFRSYLLACVRNAAVDLHRRDRKIDLRDEIPDHSPGDDDPDDLVLADLERNLVGEALKALPERWRTVLWLTEVEGMTPAEVSAVIGIKPNAVAALSYRAREGLREAYLQAHIRAEAPAECRYTVDRLGPYVRAELADRERGRVQSHLDGCARCRHRRDELADVNASLLGSLVPTPVVLGSRAQQEWLAGAHLGRGARRMRTPAKAAKLAGRDPAAATQRALALVVAILLLVAGSVSFERFGNDGEPSGLDRVALPERPPAGEAPETSAVPAEPAQTLPGPEPPTLAAPPIPATVPVRPVARPPAPRAAPRLLAPPPPVATAPADPAPPAPESPVAEPTPAPTAPPVAEPAATPAPPPPPEPPPASEPRPAAAARASVGEGATGVVVGAAVPEDGGPPEPDVTTGGEQIVGDEPPPEEGEPGVDAEGSAVPPAVSDAVAAVSDAVAAISGALPLAALAPGLDQDTDESQLPVELSPRHTATPGPADVEVSPSVGESDGRPIGGPTTAPDLLP